jgi:hypothetical protein
MVTCGVLFEVRTEFLNNIYTSHGFKGLITKILVTSQTVIYISTLTWTCNINKRRTVAAKWKLILRLIVHGYHCTVVHEKLKKLLADTSSVQRLQQERQTMWKEGVKMDERKQYGI